MLSIREKGKKIRGHDKGVCNRECRGPAMIFEFYIEYSDARNFL